tara:strand:+ start:390 stop:818 length:429 start_codon:yes stop_codon:yes gene_type:complete
MSSLLKKKITHDKTVEITIPKNTIIYDLIVLQISNLVKDLRVVFPRDIVFKVLQDNIPVFQENKFKVIQYLSENISQDIKKLIIEKNEALFDSDNKSLKNIKFRRSEFVFSKLRRNWELMQDNHKLVVWKYLNFILKLLEKV